MLCIAVMCLFRFYIQASDLSVIKMLLARLIFKQDQFYEIRVVSYKLILLQNHEFSTSLSAYVRKGSPFPSK